MKKVDKLVCGKGINDADYIVTKIKTISKPGEKRRQVIIWACPYYVKWKAMITRCYSPVAHKTQPTYKDCTVCNEWLRFSNFKSWVQQQNWEGNQLDKDLLITNNKEYSPRACCFITAKVNTFITQNNNDLVASWDKERNKFQANCRNPFTSKSEFLGRYDTPQEAHYAWLTRKLELAKLLAAEQDDPRVAKALVERYENFGRDQSCTT